MWFRYTIRMAVLPIVTGEQQPVLRAKTKEVAVTKDILKLVKDMEQTTVKADGLGLAAPQIGQSLRLCVAKLNGRLTPLINPHITFRSKETDVMEEGCLSLPNIWLPVPRSTSIVVKYLNGKGQPQERKFEAMEARIIQHEVDHLDGKLIVDYAEMPKPM